MSTKFLYITDIHNRSERDQPKSRTDSYYKSILAKQEEIGDIIEANNVDCLLFGGDLFHHFDPPMGLVNDIVSIWRSYKVDAIIGVIGSHDYNGYQVTTLRRTGVGNLVAHNLMQLVGDDRQTLFPKVITYGNVFITGTPHSAQLVLDPSNFATTKLESPKYTIQLVHGDLFNESCMWPHQTIGDIHKYITADLVLSGHIHSGWQTSIRYENPKTFTGQTEYINPGSIGRTSIGKLRSIKVVLIDSEMLNCRYITLKNVVKDPFIEKSEILEGSPMTDFSQLMKMISTLELKQTDYKQYIPHIVDQLCGDTSYKDAVLTRIYIALDEQQLLTKEH